MLIHVTINFCINFNFFYNFSRVDVCHICSRYLIVYQLGYNINVSSSRPERRCFIYVFQQFGPIIDVEIIFNERGSKVLVCVFEKLLRSWRSFSGRQQIIWFIIDVALGRPISSCFIMFEVQTNCLWTCFHFVLINPCSDTPLCRPTYENITVYHRRCNCPFNKMTKKKTNFLHFVIRCILLN